MVRKKHRSRYMDRVGQHFHGCESGRTSLSAVRPRRRISPLPHSGLYECGAEPWHGHPFRGGPFGRWRDSPAPSSFGKAVFFLKNYSITNVSAFTSLSSTLTKLNFFNIQNIPIPTNTLNHTKIQLSPHNIRNRPKAKNGGAY